MLPVNDSDVVAEVRALHEEYETALATNDVATLTRFFWNSPLALRLAFEKTCTEPSRSKHFGKLVHRWVLIEK